jgi:hypothetical protein
MDYAAGAGSLEPVACSNRRGSARKGIRAAPNSDFQTDWASERKPVSRGRRWGKHAQISGDYRIRVSQFCVAVLARYSAMPFSNSR